jgi:hypothetical protein
MKTRTHTTNVYGMSRDTRTGCPATLHPRMRRSRPAERLGGLVETELVGLQILHDRPATERRSLR